jgi:hypothetical protein
MRVKRQYFAYLAEAQGYSEQSNDAVAKSIGRFEVSARPYRAGAGKIDTHAGREKFSKSLGPREPLFPALAGRRLCGHLLVPDS